MVATYMTMIAQNTNVQFPEMGTFEDGMHGRQI